MVMLRAVAASTPRSETWNLPPSLATTVRSATSASLVLVETWAMGPDSAATLSPLLILAMVWSARSSAALRFCCHSESSLFWSPLTDPTSFL